MPATPVYVGTCVPSPWQATEREDLTARTPTAHPDLGDVVRQGQSLGSLVISREGELFLLQSAVVWRCDEVPQKQTSLESRSEPQVGP